MSLLRIGSRGSKLALWQANHIAGLLRQHGHQVEIQIIHTTGDKITGVALAQVGTKGMFTKEIEEALSAKQIDLAVHSLKDLPTELSSEYELAAIPQCESRLDVFCSVAYQNIDQLPNRARVGTSSLRRQAQLRFFRNDLEIASVRGNVDTRLRKLAAGEFDAIILAKAGVTRLGLTELVRQDLPVSLMCPAAGQGALAIEIRAGDLSTRECVAFLDDPCARATTTCERTVLQKLGGGCQVPIGACAELRGGKLFVEAVVVRPDGSELLRESSEGDDPKLLGQSVGETLLQRGAQEILEAVYG